MIEESRSGLTAAGTQGFLTAMSSNRQTVQLTCNLQALCLTLYGFRQAFSEQGPLIEGFLQWWCDHSKLVSFARGRLELLTRDQLVG